MPPAAYVWPRVDVRRKGGRSSASATRMTAQQKSRARRRANFQRAFSPLQSAPLYPCFSRDEGNLGSSSLTQLQGLQPV
eukprot:7843428-Alexandrium_andersonii.AAC.1